MDSTFNSFEDETWLRLIDGNEEREIPPFNSFEDETRKNEGSVGSDGVPTFQFLRG